MSELRTTSTGGGIVANGVAAGVGNGRHDPRPAPVSASLPGLRAPTGRSSGLILIGCAAVLGVGALALGGWAFVRKHDHAAAPPAPRAAPVDAAAPLRRALSLLTSKQSERFPLANSVGRLVLVADAQGRALLAVRDLGHAPAGRVYEAWVIPPGAAPVQAALFGGREPVVWLRRRVAHGARVAVTLERAGGARAPTRRLRLVARRQ